MLLYRILATLALAAYAPYALLRAAVGRRRLGDLRGRLGRRPYPDLDGGIWIHAVSVGEVGVAANLLAALDRAVPGQKQGLSVTTAAGRRLAETRAAARVPVFAFPFDLDGPVRRSLDAVRPGLVLLTETEIWPLFLDRAGARGIPVALVNGRLSSRSFARYGLVRRAIASSLSRIAVFAMQSSADAERALALGAPADRVRVTGNMKYDAPEASAFADAARLRLAAAGRPILVAASTAPGEEEAVLRAWRALPQRPMLALAPRRPERFDEVAALVERSGLSVLRRSSRSAPAPAATAAEPPVYLLDSIGELASLYREANVAFIGGSLVPVGGHNPIEAWAAGVPVVFGPHTQNFRQIAHDGEARGIARHAAGEAALGRELEGLLGRPDALRESGERARRFVAENRGATERTIALLSPLLASPRRLRAAP